MTLGDFLMCLVILALLVVAFVGLTLAAVIFKDWICESRVRRREERERLAALKALAPFYVGDSVIVYGEERAIVTNKDGFWLYARTIENSHDLMLHATHLFETVKLVPCSPFQQSVRSYIRRELGDGAA